MKKSWAILWTVFFAGLVVAINQFKVVPVMHILMDQLNVDMTVAGWLMSVFALAGVILSIPAAFLLNKFGSKRSGLYGLSCTILGCLIGAITPNAQILLIGRIIEGIGLGLIAVVGPAVIAMWFKAQERGLPMGIWATWVSLGSAIALNIASPIASSFGWRSIWWLGALLGIIAFIVYNLIVSNPPSEEKDELLLENKTEDIAYSFADGFKTPGIWLLGLVFFGWMASLMGLTTWAPSYFNQELGISVDRANFYTSIVYFIGIIGNILGGWILNKIKNRQAFLLIIIVISTILFPLGFQISSEGMIVPYMIILGLIPPMVPTIIFTIAPTAMPVAALGGLAMGIVCLGQNIGSLLGPPIIGNMVKTSTWSAGSYPLLVAMLIATLAAIGFALLNRRHSLSTTQKIINDKGISG